MLSRHVGFTGSRSGMTPAQISSLHARLQGAGFLWLHHGDCLGADREAHDVAVRLGIQTHRHPPTSTAFRAYCAADVSSAPAYARKCRRLVMIIHPDGAMSFEP